jgi:hypothetical protein
VAVSFVSSLSVCQLLCVNAFKYLFLTYVAVFVFKAPGPHSGEFNPFVMERVFHGSSDEVTCMDWSSDSRYVYVASTSVVAWWWVGLLQCLSGIALCCFS